MLTHTQRSLAWPEEKIETMKKIKWSGQAVLRKQKSNETRSERSREEKTAKKVSMQTHRQCREELETIPNGALPHTLYVLCVYLHRIGECAPYDLCGINVAGVVGNPWCIIKLCEHRRRRFVTLS